MWAYLFILLFHPKNKIIIAVLSLWGIFIKDQTQGGEDM